MNLGNIKNFVLGNIGRYGDTSATTEALVEANINLAIDDIVKDIISSALTETEDIVTVNRTATLNPIYTPTSINIDQIAKMRYESADDEWDIDEVNEHTLKQRISDLEGLGRPSVYLIRGNTGGIIDIAFYPITNQAGEMIKLLFYPILTDVVLNTEENIVMKKYHSTVIKFATGYSFHNIVQDRVEGDKWLARGTMDITRINAREQGGPNTFIRPLPPATLIARRQNRRSK